MTTLGLESDKHVFYNFLPSRGYALRPSFVVKKADGTYVNILNEDYAFNASHSSSSSDSFSDSQQSSYSSYSANPKLLPVINHSKYESLDFYLGLDLSNNKRYPKFSNDGGIIENRLQVDSRRRKYRCMYPNCNSAFTTGGHLSRHQRIHTGEKNFKCIYSGCNSRFSRKDNMMQHYRTHLSSKQKKSSSLQRYPLVNTQNSECPSNRDEIKVPYNAVTSKTDEDPEDGITYCVYAYG